MQTSITVSQVLREKGHDFWFISPSATAYEALELMAEKNAGALLVMEGGKLVGMFSERDYARKVILKGKSSKSTRVHELMTGNPVSISPDKTIGECMILMTNNHIRHVPVVVQGSVAGIVSIGDVVHSIISLQETRIQDLETYITAG